MADELFEAQAVRWRRRWSRQGRSIDTFETYLHEVERYLEWCTEGRHNSVALESADLYVAELEDRSKHAARWAARSIKSYGKYLVEDELHPATPGAKPGRDSGPFHRLSLPNEPEPTNAPMATAGDLKNLLAACVPWDVPPGFLKPWDHLRDKAIILVLATTGMRRGECAAMSLDDLDLADESINLRRTKNGESRHIRIPEDTVLAIMKYLKASSWAREPDQRALWLSIHRRPHGALTASGLGQMVQKRGKAAKVDVRAHAFQRFYASEWMYRGGSETGLMSTAGWKTSAMVARYTKASRERNAREESKRLFG